MRFPLSLTTTMVGYIAKKKITRQQRFPLRSFQRCPTAFR